MRRSMQFNYHFIWFRWLLVVAIDTIRRRRPAYVKIDNRRTNRPCMHTVWPLQSTAIVRLRRITFAIFILANAIIQFDWLAYASVRCVWCPVGATHQKRCESRHWRPQWHHRRTFPRFSRTDSQNASSASLTGQYRMYRSIIAAALFRVTHISRFPVACSNGLSACVSAASNVYECGSSLVFRWPATQHANVHSCCVSWAKRSYDDAHSSTPHIHIAAAVSWAQLT